MFALPNTHNCSQKYFVAIPESFTNISRNKADPRLYSQAWKCSNISITLISMPYYTWNKYGQNNENILQYTELYCIGVGVKNFWFKTKHLLNIRKSVEKSEFWCYKNIWTPYKLMLEKLKWQYFFHKSSIFCPIPLCSIMC